MKVTHRTWVARSLGVLALLHPQSSEAQPEPSVIIDVAGALSGADHYVELHRAELRVDSTWVLAAGVIEGSQIPLEPALPSDARVECDRMVAVRNAHREVVAAGLFRLAAAGVYQVYRRAQRAVDRERVDAYLVSLCAPDEARAWGIGNKDPAEPQREL